MLTPTAVLQGKSPANIRCTTYCTEVRQEWRGCLEVLEVVFIVVMFGSHGCPVVDKRERENGREREKGRKREKAGCRNIEFHPVYRIYHGLAGSRRGR